MEAGRPPAWRPSNARAPPNPVHVWCQREKKYSCIRRRRRRLRRRWLASLASKRAPPGRIGAWLPHCLAVAGSSIHRFIPRPHWGFLRMGHVDCPWRRRFVVSDPFLLISPSLFAHVPYSPPTPVLWQSENISIGKFQTSLCTILRDFARKYLYELPWLFLKGSESHFLGTRRITSPFQFCTLICKNQR